MLLMTAAGCAAAEPTGAAVRAVPLQTTPRLAAILPDLARKRVVFVGESHTEYAHHLNQLAIIRGIHARRPDLAIGLEMFQRPFQKVLDRYVAGEIDTRTLLIEAEYYRRWRFDFRLYAPILEYAREHRIPLVALNASHELTSAVSRNGLEGLSPHQRDELPGEIDPSNAAYRQRLQAVFDSHPASGDFQTFHDVQLVWDETMAETAAEYLKSHPERHMIVLAGHGHLAYGDGIPQRLQRRLKVDTAIVLNDWPGPFDPELADYLLLAEARELPPRGELGVYLQPAEDSGVRVAQVAENGAAAQAGLQAQDVITRIDGVEVFHPSHVQAVLWDAAPGRTVAVTRREGEPRELQVTLHRAMPETHARR